MFPIYFPSEILELGVRSSTLVLVPRCERVVIPRRLFIALRLGRCELDAYHEGARQQLLETWYNSSGSEYWPRNVAWRGQVAIV